MKHTLPNLFLLLLTISAQAQLTRISNNTNLIVGLPVTENRAVFVQEGSGTLWTTDGTPGGTSALAVPVTYDFDGGIILWNHKIYFSGISTHGAELWVTDGTAGGTQLLKDINTGADSSRPEGFFPYNGNLYFFAETNNLGKELWKTDGTAGGTSLVKDIYPGASSSFSDSTDFTPYNGLVFFGAKTDLGVELWRTDGTEGGTQMVRDIRLGAASSWPQFLEASNNGILFTADDGQHGREIWRSYGIEASTALVRDIQPGPGNSGVTSMINFNGKLLFGAAGIPGNEELWTTDGTFDGTILFKELQPGTEGSMPQVFNSIVINNKLIFFAYSSATGKELFVTDGTPTGTTLFKDVVPGTAGSDPVILQDRDFFNQALSNRNLYNGKIFFTAISSTGTDQLWITDGTPDNTTLVKDFGLFGLFFNSWFYTRSGLYFAAAKEGLDFEVFKSEGTPATTQLFAEINAQPEEGSMPFFQFFLLNGKVFVSADDGDSEDGDRDLFVLGANEQVLPLVLLHFGAAAGNQGVALQWTTYHEANTRGFELERSLDGEHFSRVATLQAAGGPGQRKDYHFVDADAYKKDVSALYYRLKMMDQDGVYRYSRVVAVPMGKPAIANVQFHPNPVRGPLWITLQTPKAGTSEITFFGAGGQAVMHRRISLNAGYNQLAFSLESLPAGVYYVEIRTADGRKVERLVKQ